MIDFNQNTFFKLKEVKITDGEKMVQGLLIDGEQVLSAYRDIRDYVIFTDKRVISVNVEKATGKKKNYTVLPYAKISVFAVETAGVMDVDSRMDMWFSGLGHVRFEFTGRCDTVKISKTVARYALEK